MRQNEGRTEHTTCYNTPITQFRFSFSGTISHTKIPKISQMDRRSVQWGCKDTPNTIITLQSPTIKQPRDITQLVT